MMKWLRFWIIGDVEPGEAWIRLGAWWVRHWWPARIRQLDEERAWWKAKVESYEADMELARRIAADRRRVR